MIASQAMQALKAAVSKWADSTHGAATVEAMQKLERGEDGHIDVVLFPANAHELKAVVKLLNEYKLSSTTIGGQTGLVEAQRAQGIAISTQLLNAPVALLLADGTRLPFSAARPELAYTEQLEFWREEARAATQGLSLEGMQLVVQAGMAVDAINGRDSTGDEPGGFPGILQAIGRKLPIVMASTPTATIGATIANGSAGANAIRYGTAADMATEVEAVLGTGEIVRHRNSQPRAQPQPDAPVIRSDRFSHGDSAIGSQGVFSIITEATLQTYAIPKEQVITLFPVATCAQAQHVLAQAQTYFSEQGEAIELFELIRGGTLQRAQAHSQKRINAREDGRYYLLMQLTSEQAQPESEFFPDHSAFFEKMAMFFMDGLKAANGELMFPDAEGVDYDSNPHRLMAVREAASEMSRGKPKRTYDIVVPLAQLDAFVEGLEALAQADYPSLQLEVFGHAGVGALHIHFIGDVATICANQLDSAVFDLAQSLGGSPWAEHGVGSKWGDEWQARTPAAVQQAMLAIAKKNDPNNVLGSHLFGFDRLYKGV